ncbi:MAG: DUF3326 domain-containing protein [Candidatus Melainabacteria bacterium]|nr:DUF3326 domain-containing protein [Candidatus Melainabacteria bacterium]
MPFQIQEQIVEIDNPKLFQWMDVYSAIQKSIKNLKDNYIIKLNLVKSSKSKLYFHVVYVEDFIGFIDEPFKPSIIESFKDISKADEISCLIIPTGVGAQFGGYAGDANPLAKALANSSKYLLTHPNVVNGAVLTDLPQNLIYLEGFLLDQFLSGRINLLPNKRNKIGVIFDSGINEKRLEYEINVLNAVRAFYGCNILAWTLTDKPMLINPSINEFGFSSGSIKNFEYVIEKAFKLKEAGATAIALCTAIPDSDSSQGYMCGSGVDPIGGVESIMSHIVSSACGLVSAHGPVLLSDDQHKKTDYKNISPLAAGEYIAETFLPSVISGLRFAPQITESPDSKSVKNVSSIIVPYNAFGSAGVFYCNEEFQNVVLVKENKTCLDISPDDLNIRFKVVDSYIDITNSRMLSESGIDTDALRRPIKSIQKI